MDVFNDSDRISRRRLLGTGGTLAAGRALVGSCRSLLTTASTSSATRFGASST